MEKPVDSEKKYGKCHWYRGGSFRVNQECAWGLLYMSKLPGKGVSLGVYESAVFGYSGLD